MAIGEDSERARTLAGWLRENPELTAFCGFIGRACVADVPALHDLD
jgi:hypothetical protein